MGKRAGRFTAYPLGRNPSRHLFSPCCVLWRTNCNCARVIANVWVRVLLGDAVKPDFCAFDRGGVFLFAVIRFGGLRATRVGGWRDIIPAVRALVGVVISVRDFRFFVLFSVWIFYHGRRCDLLLFSVYVYFGQVEFVLANKAVLRLGIVGGVCNHDGY